MDKILHHLVPIGETHWERLYMMWLQWDKTSTGAGFLPQYPILPQSFCSICPLLSRKGRIPSLLPPLLRRPVESVTRDVISKLWTPGMIRGFKHHCFSMTVETASYFLFSESDFGESVLQDHCSINQRNSGICTANLSGNGGHVWEHGNQQWKQQDYNQQNT